MSRPRHDLRAAPTQQSKTGDLSARIRRWIPLAQCRPRTIYELYSRNLAVGVFDGKGLGGFVGVRHKAGATYLFTEYHIEAPAFNTVRPLRELGTVPEGIEVQECLGTVCQTCGSRQIGFVEHPEPVRSVATRADGSEYEVVERGQWACSGCTVPRPLAVGNPALLELLLPLEAAILAADREERA